MSSEYRQCEDLPHVDGSSANDGRVSACADGVLPSVFDVRYSLQYPAEETEAKRVVAADHVLERCCHHQHGGCQECGRADCCSFYSGYDRGG